MFNDIPKMTHELSAYWRQPSNIREAPMDNETVLLTQRQFDELSDYSASMPSGTYVGKCWRRAWYEKDRQTVGGWWLGWYGVDPDPKFLTNNWRRIIVV